MYIHKSERADYETAKKFCKKFYFNNDSDLLSIQNPYLKDILENIRSDILRFKILEELGIDTQSFNKKFDRIAHNMRESQQKHENSQI